MLSLLFIVLAVLCCVGWAANIPSPLDYHVTGLDKFGANDKMYAGLMPLAFESNTEGAIFFWLAKQRNRNPNEKRKLVIWLNGGPGCSSMVGMMWENGPFNIEFGGKKNNTSVSFNVTYIYLIFYFYHNRKRTKVSTKAQQLQLEHCS